MVTRAEERSSVQNATGDRDYWSCTEHSVSVSAEFRNHTYNLSDLQLHYSNSFL